MASTSRHCAALDDSEIIDLLNDLADSDTDSDSDFVDNLLDDNVSVLHPGFDIAEDDMPDERESTPIIVSASKGKKRVAVAKKKKDKTLGLKWNYYSHADIHCTPNDFIGTPGVNVPINDPNDVYYLFNLFFTDELIDLLVEQTNLYAEKVIGSKILKRFSRYHSWKPTDKDEMFLFLAMHMLTGLIWKPQIEKYYTTKPIFCTPGFPRLLSLKRFRLLSRFLHFTDSSIPPPAKNKKLHKIQPILDYLLNRFSEVYTPERDLAVDESLLLWKGRLSFMQFIRIKRARFGIKSFIVSESTSGYIYKIIVYVGSETNLNENPNHGQMTNVVLTLLERSNLLDKGYCVYTDNAYCSPELALALVARHTDLVGTVRTNRLGIPKEIIDFKLEKNEVISMCDTKGEIMMLKWQDKRTVLCLSTKHDTNFVLTKRKGKEALVPSIVHDYNVCMGGVDRVDQMLSAYPLERKRQKVWYKKQFRHLVNIAIFNAHVVHKKSGGKYKSLQFREALIESIVERHHRQSPKKGRPTLEVDPLRLRERHFPEYIPGTEKKKNASKRCVVCASKKIRKESRYYCVECDVGLCAAPCFKTFHTKKDYKN